MNPIVKPIETLGKPKPTLRSPIPPIPPESFGRRLWRRTKFGMVIAFFIFVWAASSLVVAPVVQWTMTQTSNWISAKAGLTQEAFLEDLKLSIPCESFESIPPGCGDGLDVGEMRYGASSVLYFFGHLPALDGLTFRERASGLTPDGVLDGAFFTLQKSFGALPVGDAATALAKDEMATYGAYEERQLAADVTAYQASEGSSVRVENFYAVYTRADGVKLAAACFGETCKVLQAPWRGTLAYGLTIPKTKAADLPAIDAAVRARLDGFVVQ